MSQSSRVVSVLDHGFVQLIDTMGEDATPAMDARTSRGHQGEQRPWDEDARLIRYMDANGHTTPFEMVETKWLCKMPIFVARQWVRHRTASITEFSMRYADAGVIGGGEIEFYDPASWRLQGGSNRQGSVGALEPVKSGFVTRAYQANVRNAISIYESMVREGVANEMARLVLPVSVYTEWVWKIDLHNLLHFLRLRTDEHAQWEMRQYALAIEELLRERFPQLMEIVRPA